jgi:hypothetical protein
MLMCSTKPNAARRRYLQGGAMVMVGYLLTVFGTSFFVRHHHDVRGSERAALALLPSLPIFVFLFVVARYLREESDGYQRDLLVRSMLWGVAVLLCLSCFTSFLSDFGWTGRLPPFTEFCTFWVSVGVAKGIYRFSNRVPVDA